MKKLWIALRNKLAVKIAVNVVYAEYGYQYVEAYFAQVTAA